MRGVAVCWGGGWVVRSERCSSVLGRRVRGEGWVGRSERCSSGW